MGNFPIVGIGSSAGGLEALEKLLRAMPADAGFGFVVIAHLDPTRESHLTSLLRRCTQMPVAEVSEKVRVERDHVYVIAPDQYLTIHGGVLHPSRPKEPRGERRPIDLFLRSLAADQRERAIGIVLSGTGTSGALGLREIKGEGGIAIAQEPATAGYSGMPRSAIATGLVDLVLSPERIPEALLKLGNHPYIRRQVDAVAADEIDGELSTVLNILRTRAKQDFRPYRRRTLLRRILRRMGLRHIESIGEYIQQLRRDADEAAALARDLTISVTGFFRDPEAWEALRKTVIAPLVAEPAGEAGIRAWVPACATGEEAYSLAILFAEQAEAQRKPIEIRIFATDVVQDVLAIARSGLYPASINAEIGSERLERYFDREDDSYRVRKPLREMITFTPQNLLHDPPFSRLDLISCRNLLIYLEPEVQKRLLGMFHFALRPDRFLFLGPAETVSGRPGLFAVVAKKWRIHRRIGPTRRDTVAFPVADSSEAPLAIGPRIAATPRARLGDLAQRALLERFAPASVLIDEEFHVHYFHGPSEDYLRPPSGEPTYNLLSMAREGLGAAIRAAVLEVRQSGRELSVDARVRRGHSLHPVRLTVAPLRLGAIADHMLVVSFLEREPDGSPPPGPGRGADRGKPARGRAGGGPRGPAPHHRAARGLERGAEGV